MRCIKRVIPPSITVGNTTSRTPAIIFDSRDMGSSFAIEPNAALLTLVGLIWSSVRIIGLARIDALPIDLPHPGAHVIDEEEPPPLRCIQPPFPLMGLRFHGPQLTRLVLFSPPLLVDLGESGIALHIDGPDVERDMKRALHLLEARPQIAFRLLVGLALAIGKLHREIRRSQRPHRLRIIVVVGLRYLRILGFER